MPRRGENIYKRKDGRWEARYIKEVSVDGNKKYDSVYAKTYNEVKAKQQMVLLPEKTKHKLVKYTISDIMYEWLENNKNQVKITSYQKYKSTIENHIIPELGKVQIQSLTSVMIQQYTNKLLSKEISRTTVNDVLIVLGMGLSYAEEEYHFHIPKISLVKNPPKEMRVLSVSEQNIFVEYLLNKNDAFSFGMLLALFTGLRIGELCAMTWDDIGENTIRVNKTIQRVQNDGYTEILTLPPKTTSSNRIIPIPQELMCLLKSKRANGAVLKQDNGKQIEPRLMQMKFKKYTAECGIENINFHSLRHSFQPKHRTDRRYNIRDKAFHKNYRNHFLCSNLHLLCHFQHFFYRPSEALLLHRNFIV